MLYLQKLNKTLRNSSGTELEKKPEKPAKTRENPEIMSVFAD